MLEADGWQRIDDHASVRGEFTISHARVRGAHRFLLWEGDAIRGAFNDVTAAKRAAHAIEVLREKAA